MSYNTKYIIPFYSRGNSGNIYLKKLNYSGDTQELTLLEDGLKYSVEFDDWFKPIIKQNVSFNILNDASNYFDYIDLFELDEREFQTVIEITNENDGTITLFDGWLNCDIVESKYLHNSTVNLNASNYLSKLKYDTIDRVETIHKSSLMNIIGDILTTTGKYDYTKVNNNLYPSNAGSILNTEGLYTLCGVDTELFWTNNIERMNNVDILESILTSTDSYIYWWNGYWYIERYRDLYNTNKSILTYSNTNEYSFGSGVTRTYENRTIKDVQDLEFRERTQTLSNIPGFKELEIALNQKQYLNLTINDFSDASIISVMPEPDYRSWQFQTQTDFQYLFKGQPKYNLANTVARSFTYLTIGTYFSLSFLEPWNGIATSFLMTNDLSGTTLDISWTNILPDWYFVRDADPPAEPIEKHTFECYYYIRMVSDTSTYYYLKYDNEEREWSLSNGSGTDEQNMNKVLHNALAVYDDQNAIFRIENNVKIPVSDIISHYEGDIGFVLGIGLPIAKRDLDGKYVYPAAPTKYEYVGDVVITASSPLQDNLIKYDVSANTLEKKKIDLDLFDIDDLNYKNGVYTQLGYEHRTDLWKERNQTTEYSLTDWLAYSKFQLYNRNRKRINGDITYNGFIKPFDLFYDSADNDRKYLITSYDYYPTKDKYIIELTEYDSSTAININ